MTDIATGRRPRSSKLDKFPAAFAVAGAKQEKAADEETLIYYNDSRVIRRLTRRGWKSGEHKRLKNGSTVPP
jgi:hypothetical protein